MVSSELRSASGVHLCLRLVTLDDAEYIHELRSNPAYGRYLSRYRGTVDTQRQWLAEYKAREAALEELYYIIERKADSLACGVVRLYDIGEQEFTWGSWILDHKKPAKAALESALLSFGVGFETLAKPTAHVDVRNENTKAQDFYKRLGMHYVSQNEMDTFFEYSAAQYKEGLEKHWKVIRSEQPLNKAHRND